MGPVSSADGRRLVSPKSNQKPGDIPLGASVSLFMFPILAIAAVFILRGVRKRGREIA